MQKKIEIDKVFFERLNLRHAETEAERDRMQKELQALKSELTKANSTGRWSSAIVSAVSILAVATLLYNGVFHDAQSKVKDNNPREVSAMNALVTGQIVRADHQATSGKKVSRSDKKKSHSARTKAASQRQWGPLLVMPEAAANKPHLEFNPLVKQQQKNLRILGFNIGKADGFKGARTRQALAEFRALYLPDSGKELQDDELAVIIENYANLARSDAVRFGIDHGIVAAIRLSSVRTGVDFSYLMKLAATESNFKPASKSPTSSATGMYQFTHNTWLNALKMHGAKYGHCWRLRSDDRILHHGIWGPAAHRARQTGVPAPA